MTTTKDTITKPDIRSIMKTGRINRMIRIIIALQSAQRYDIEELAKLSGVSRRTIYRDLKDLQKAGVPCRYGPGDHSYMIDKGFFLPAPDLSTVEALGLLLSVYKVGNHIGFPFRRSALSAALKIENNLSSEVKRFCRQALENITIKGDLQTDAGSLDELFMQLIEAISKKQIVKIRYYLASEKKSSVFDLKPYHLFYNEHIWHVLGKSELCDSIRAFKLNRIRKLHVLDKCFVEDKKFDIQEYLGRAWSMLPEGRLYHVKLKFSPEVAHDVAGVQWHSTQTVIFQDDGSAIVEFCVDGLNEIMWWILRYGDQVQVLAPKILKRRIVEIAQNMAKQNEQLLLV